eukprot:TRINITY_DN20933_c0_g1_i1.p4 TRINITY_DN20933_c0_g1~~TRINITY_DN20933_c0_g1_i1.p4  ORF type:complete len:110 (+),score=1.12 TRINITY_DN20933_c0_g1_i1:68-397(+)
MIKEDVILTERELGKKLLSILRSYSLIYVVEDQQNILCQTIHQPELQQRKTTGNGQSRNKAVGVKLITNNIISKQEEDTELKKTIKEFIERQLKEGKILTTFITQSYSF